MAAYLCNSSSFILPEGLSFKVVNHNTKLKEEIESLQSLDLVQGDYLILSNSTIQVLEDYVNLPELFENAVQVEISCFGGDYAEILTNKFNDNFFKEIDKESFEDIKVTWKSGFEPSKKQLKALDNYEREKIIGFD